MKWDCNQFARNGRRADLAHCVVFVDGVDGGLLAREWMDEWLRCVYDEARSAIEVRQDQRSRSQRKLSVSGVFTWVKRGDIRNSTSDVAWQGDHFCLSQRRACVYVWSRGSSLHRLTLKHSQRCVGPYTLRIAHSGCTQV